MLLQGARDEEAARGGDADAAEKTKRLLVDIDGQLAEAESELAWPDLDERVRDRIAVAMSWVAEFATPDERTVFTGAMAAIEKARTAKNPQEIDRQLATLRRLGHASYLRSPGAWEAELDRAAGRISEATDPRSAAQLVEQARAAAASQDAAALERAVRSLWQLLPVMGEDRELGHRSGVR